MNCHNPNISKPLSLITTTKADYSGKPEFDQVVVEEPLQITLYWQDQSAVFTITMRTPGDDEALALGLLFCEGQIKDKHQIVRIEFERHDHQDYPNHLQVYYQSGYQPDLSDTKRQLISQSSCGICGKTSLKALELQSTIPLDNTPGWLDKTQLTQLPDILLSAQPLFTQCGGTHGVALFDHNYQLLDCREDIGRHNALDKVIGASLMNDRKAGRHIVVLSGRVSFELVQKAICAGYPVVIAVGAPSSLAIDAAKRFDLTLIGFTKPGSFNVYSGQWRLK